MSHHKDIDTVPDILHSCGHKYRFLILGGCGFIGRNLVHYLLSRDLPEKIRVVDKVSPLLAYLNDSHREAFDSPIVEFVSGNLIRQECREKAFRDTEPFNYVVNLASENKPGLTDAVYQEGVTDIVVSCAKLAAKHKVDHFVEVSSGYMFTRDRPSSEDEDPDPWIPEAKFKLLAEKELSRMTDFKYTILRPAIVYGHGDFKDIAQRVVLAAIYKHLKQPLKVLWSSKLMMNTVHVLDVCSAIVHVIQTSGTNSQIYHVVDKGNSTQGLIMDTIAGRIFGVNVEYVNNYFVTTASREDIEAVVDDVNDKHAMQWAEICKLSNISSTPLSPYLVKEKVQNKHLSLDGTKLLLTGYKHLVPEFSEEHLREAIAKYVDMRLFPSDCLTLLNYDNHEESVRL